MGDDETFDDLGPGLHVLREGEPLKRAGAMAAQMRADLCATLPQADATLADRGALPPIDVTTLTTLQVLARRVARAERIAARTRDRAAEEVSRRITAASTGLAVHPTTVRERAAAVDDARAAVVEAERQLAEHEAAVAAAEAAPDREGAEHATAGTDDPPSPAAPGDPAEGSAVTLKARRSRALGAIVAAFGLALVLLGAGVLPLWAALLLPFGASLWALRYLGHHDEEEDDDDGRSEVSSRLAEVSATTDEIFGARRADQELADRTALLEAARDRAREEVRVAERAWHELAGPDADVADLEAIVARFDPQHEDAKLLAAETPGVRAAEVVLHQFRQRWMAFWRELGLPAPDADHGEAAVDDLARKVSRPIVLVGPATERGADLARVAPCAPVVALHGPVDGGHSTASAAG